MYSYLARQYGAVLLSLTMLLLAREVRSEEIDQEGATAYAAQVLRAIELVRKRHVHEIPAERLVRSAVESLYEKAGYSIPEDVAQLPARTTSERRDYLIEARERLGERGEFQRGQDIDVSVDGMLRRLDPYSNYTASAGVSRKRWSQWTEYSSLGINFRMDASTGGPVVFSPLMGSPAHRAGVRAGDVITHFIIHTDERGHPLDEPRKLSAAALTQQQVEDLIVGPPGVEITLTVQRPGVDEALDFDLRREVFALETVLGWERREDGRWDYFLDREARIAYVRLPTFFARDTAEELARVLNRLERAGMSGLVLDLRGNPGGRVLTGVAVADLFIGDGPIVTVRSRVTADQPHTGKREGSFRDFPVVCLINGDTASVSELVAACLQDHDRAVIVGERSHGKGSVQEVHPFHGGQIKLTTALWYRPNGANLDRALAKRSNEGGVNPDRGFVVELTQEERKAILKGQLRRFVIDPRPRRGDAPSVDRQLEKALEHLREHSESVSR